MRNGALSMISVVILVGACTSEPASTPTAAVSGGSVSETTTTVATTTIPPAGAAFASCMAEHGVEVGDIGSETALSLDAITAALDTGDPVTRDALDECASILTTSGLFDLTSDPEAREMILADLDRFSACMRDQGLATFPDPDPDFDGTGDPYPADRLPLTAPGFAEARSKCEELIGLTGTPG